MGKRNSVVQLKPRRHDDVWECGSCGCQLFYLMETLEVQCRGCGWINGGIFLTTIAPEDRDEK